MSAVTDYRCTRCKKKTARDLLTVKKIQFLEMGVKGKTLKTRTADWLCPACIVQDEHWKKEAYDAPGLRDDTERPSVQSPVLTSAPDSATIGTAAQIVPRERDLLASGQKTMEP